LQYGYLQQSSGQYPVLQLTEKGKTTLYKREQVYLSAPVNIEIAKEPEVYQQHPYEKELFEKLKHLRNRIAREENVPAYIIFSDSTLMDLATYLPLTTADLLKISGFGQVKTEKYGQLFLEVVQDYCNEHKFETRINLKQPKRERKQRPPATVERSSDTRRVSYNMFLEGKTIAEIAEERDLSTNTIESHLSYYITGGNLSIDDVVDSAKQKAIQKAAELFGTISLKTLKENLPEEISYGEIRMVLASLLKQ
jgi:ATP-dependent DNA helicase RecQ